MADKTRNGTLTEGPITSSLLRFSLPVIASMLVTQLTSLADTMVVGNLMDANALAAVSNAATILMYFTFISGGMELAGGLLVAARGPVSTQKQMAALTWTLLAVDMAVSIVMLGLGVLLFRPLLLLINTPEEILEQALLYGRIYLCGLPFLMIYDLSRQIMIGCGISGMAMYFGLGTSVLNIVLDLLLVGPLGVAGAALASALSQAAGFVCVAVWLRKNLLTERFRLSMVSRDCLKDILRLAPPNTVQQMSGTLVTSIKQSLLGSLGVAAIAGYSCAYRVSYFIQIPIFGAAQALVTFIARNAAVHQEDRIRAGIRAAYGLLLILTAVLSALCMLLREPILRLFTSDADTLALGLLMLAWEPPSYLIQVVRHVQEAQLRGRQRMALYLTSSISAMAVGVLACTILVRLTGFAAFYLSSYVSSVYAAICSGLLVRYAKRHPARETG